ncbi:SpaA isopeptide-forming pilin-related protein [Enterocloster clostridioformis]
MVTPEELKAGTYRIEEVKAPEGFVRQGSEMAKTGLCPK